MRFLAYGSIPQFGLIALTVQGDELCQRLSVLYLVVYLNALAKFLCLLDSLKIFETFINLMDLNVVNKNTFIKYYMLGLILELGGLPPSNLFFIKFYIIGFFLQYFIFQMFIFLVLSILMCFYYLRLIKILFYEMEDNNYFTTLSKLKINGIFIEQFLENFIVGIIIFVSV